MKKLIIILIVMLSLVGCTRRPRLGANDIETFEGTEYGEMLRLLVEGVKVTHIGHDESFKSNGIEYKPIGLETVGYTTTATYHVSNVPVDDGYRDIFITHYDDLGSTSGNVEAELELEESESGSDTSSGILTLTIEPTFNNDLKSVAILTSDNQANTAHIIHIETNTSRKK